MDNLFVFIDSSKLEEDETSPLLANKTYTEDRIGTEALDRFHRIYCVVFALFATRWREAEAEDAMAFPHVFGPFKVEVENLVGTSQGIQALQELYLK